MSGFPRANLVVPRKTLRRGLSTKTQARSITVFLIALFVEKVKQTQIPRMLVFRY